MDKGRIYTLDEIFTSSLPVYYAYVERKIVNRRLERALKMKSKQIIIYGYSGAGKTLC